jgi:glycosyltransferase involved in cell wall biosynthesis
LVIVNSIYEITSKNSIQELNKPIVVVGIPAYNEEKTIAQMVLASQKEADIVIVCDDGSSDLTAEIAERLGAVVIRHKENLGKGCALRNIFEKSKEFNPDIIVTIDADGQHNPKEIPQIIEPLILNQCDIVLGSRYELSANHKIPTYRRFGLALIDWLNRRANNSGVKDSQNGFRAFNSNAFNTVSSSKSDGFSVESEQITLATQEGLRIVEVPISTRYKGIDKSSKKSPLIHGIGLVGYLLKVIIEDHPLRYLGVPSLIFMTIGTYFGIWMLQIFTSEHIIITNNALAFIGFTFTGFFCGMASLMLYSISKLSEKINRKSKKEI